MKYIHSIAAPATPIFAVYSNSGDLYPQRVADLYLAECPIVAVMTLPDGTQHIPLIVDEYGLANPECSNFLGYAGSKSQAALRFLPEPSRPTLAERVGKALRNLFR